MSQVQQLLASAIQHHQSGQLGPAAKLYQEVLAREPRHADAVRLLGVVAHQVGDHAEAERLFQQAIAINPGIAEYHSNLGLALQAQGKTDLALAAYQRAIDLKPTLADAHYNRGVALGSQNKLRDTVAAYRRAIELQPQYADAWNNLGNALRAMGDTAGAMDAYRTAIRLRPDHAEAHNNLGNALKDQGQMEPAIAAYHAAIRANPRFPDAHYNLGNTLQAEKQWEAAVAAYRDALALAPRDVRIHINLGIALQEQDRIDDAIDAYRRAIELDRSNADAPFNLGNAFQARQNHAAAIVAYRDAIVLRPTWAEAHNNLANAFKALGRTSEAIAAYREAIRLRPEFAEAHNNLGNILNTRGEGVDEAIACYRRALEINPGYAEAHNNLGGALKEQGLLDEALGCFRRAMALKPAMPAFGSNLVYTMHFHAACDARQIAAEHRAWNQRHARPLARLIRPHGNDRDPERPLRVGMISPDFRNHPIGRFLLPWFAAHDPAACQLYCYSDVLRPDAITEELRSHADRWRSTAGLSHPKAAALVRQDGIDILLDLTMHMQGSRLLVFAQKPAPIQATYLAYCSSTGLDTIDYRLTDPHFDPPSSSPAPPLPLPPDSEDAPIYTEKSLHLQSYWCYQPSPEAPPVEPTPALKSGYITFGCLNNFSKITEPVLHTWIQLLRAVPDSHLLLHSAAGSHQDRLRARLEREGIEPERLRFAGMLPMADYFRLYHEIDIALDPWPYAGGTTTCDGLWMGVPLITLRGATAVGRGGVSILNTLGLPDLIASSSDAYITLATGLAGDLSRLADLRTTLRDRMRSSRLMDAPAFARDLEHQMRDIWRTWCAQ